MYDFLKEHCFVARTMWLQDLNVPQGVAHLFSDIPKSNYAAPLQLKIFNLRFLLQRVFVYYLR